MKVKISELRAKSVAELETELTALLREQFNLRMQHGMGEMPRPQSFRNSRRMIARIKTILREKEREKHE